MTTQLDRIELKLDFLIHAAFRSTGRPNATREAKQAIALLNTGLVDNVYTEETT